MRIYSERGIVLNIIRLLLGCLSACQEKACASMATRSGGTLVYFVDFSKEAISNLFKHDSYTHSNFRLIIPVKLVHDIQQVAFWIILNGGKK